MFYFLDKYTPSLLVAGHTRDSFNQNISPNK